MTRLGTSLGLVLASAALVGAQPGPVTRPAPVPLVVALVPYLGDANLQRELKLEDAQVKRLLAARQTLWDAEWTTAPKDAAPDTWHKAVEAEFKAVLSADQLKRAGQIAMQLEWRDTRRVSAATLAKYPAVADALALDATLKKRAADARFGVVYLTPDQAAAAKGLLGAELKAVLVAQSDPRWSADGGAAVYSREPLALTANSTAALQKDLRLTESQLDALLELRRAWNRSPAGPSGQTTSPAARLKAYREQLPETNKALEKVLTADQFKRLKQIERQRGGPDAPFAPESEAGRELGVTAAQRKWYEAAITAHGEAVAAVVLSDKGVEAAEAAIAAAGKERDAAVAAVLTADQKEMLGERYGRAPRPFGFPPGKGGPGGGGFGGSSRLPNQPPLGAAYQVILDTAVWDELKLDREQEGKLAVAANTYMPLSPPRQFTPGVVVTKEQMIATQTAADEAFGKAVDGALTAAQRKRLDQLAVQRAIADSLASALLGGSNQVPLDLTADQKAKIGAVRDEASRRATLLGGANVTYGQEQEIRTRLRDRLDTDLLKELTAEQKAKLKELTGEPFDGFPRQPLNRFSGFGGPFGP